MAVAGEDGCRTLEFGRGGLTWQEKELEVGF